ncbi:hypothetical protein Leryth_025934 [Lithospermum erythrorhizon]|nr:hypothetical protein Leryth_025934 [Lithospermum erythrorhizon]
MLIGCTTLVVKVENDDILRDCQEIYKTYESELDEDDDLIHLPEWPTFDLPPPSPPPDIQIQVLELPTRLSKEHQLPLSDTVILVGEGTLCSKVFALDTRTCNLYFVLTKPRRLKDKVISRSGYAAVGDKLYFLGSGHYPDRRLVNEVIDWANTDHIDVEAYNLRTKEWDKNITKLNCPKPLPVVFVSGKWTPISSENLELYPVAQLLDRIPYDSFIGACIAEDCLFTYETGWFGNPEIVYYDLDDYIINPKGERIDLSDMFDGGYNFVNGSSTGHLNYLRDDKFSLVINSFANRTCVVWAVCCCTFELRKVPTRKTDPRVSKQPRLSKFSPRLICCKAYQVPENVTLEFCQKLQ